VHRAPEAMPVMPEEDEHEELEAARGDDVPAIQVSATNDEMADIDKSVELRVRSLYGYEGQRPEDLCTSFRMLRRRHDLITFPAFGENLVLTAHPSKSGGDWWYGTLVRDGKSGFFPKSYVQEVETGENFPRLSRKACY
jgi:actin cytoskeleton-regulatory complex protein PAN1